MREAQKAMHICGIRLRHTATEAKGIALMVIVPIIVWSIIQPVVDMSFAIEKPVSIMGIVFLLGDMYGSATGLLFSLGAILLFCDAPFRDEQQVQCLARCRTRTWICAQLLSIVCLSAIYVLYWLLSMALTISQNAVWELEWGTVWNTLARTNAAKQFGVPLECSPGLIRQYEPAASLLMSLLLKFVYCCFIGNVCFCINMLTHSNAGIVTSGFFALQDFLAINYMPYEYTWLSPATLSRLSALDPSGTYLLPTPGQALIVLGGSTCVLGILSICFGRRRIMEGYI